MYGLVVDLGRRCIDGAAVSVSVSVAAALARCRQSSLACSVYVMCRAVTQPLMFYFIYYTSE